MQEQKVLKVSDQYMTCTSIVWNPSQNGFGITKNFKIILGLRKFLKSISHSKCDFGILKMDKSYNLKPVASFDMSYRSCC